MKNKFSLFLSVVLFILFSTTISVKVIAKEILPKITTVCESKSGLLFTFNDGFSLLRNCTGSDRRIVVLGGQAQNGEKGETGATGPQGLLGPQGATGPQGSKGEAGVTSQSFYNKTYGPYQVDLSNGTGVHMECDAGDMVISGGLSDSEGDTGNWITNKSGHSSSDQKAWEIFVSNTNFSKRWSFTTTITCLKLNN